MIRRPPRSTLFPSPTLSRSAGGHIDVFVAHRLPADALRLAAQEIGKVPGREARRAALADVGEFAAGRGRSEEHTAELQSRQYLVCRLLLEKKKKSTLFTDNT